MFDIDNDDFEPFQKMKKSPKTGDVKKKKSDYSIREARRYKEKTKQSIIEEQEVDEELEV